MKEPDRSHNDEQHKSRPDPAFGDAISELTKNLQWEKMMTDGGCGREVLSLTISTEERHHFLQLLKPVARDFALDTGVLLPSVAFQEGHKRILTWGDTVLGELNTDDPATELLRILRMNSWRFLTIRQVEARLKKLWTDRPELQRAFDDVNLSVSRTVRVLRDLLKCDYSIRNFAAVMESIILNRSQYSGQNDLFDAVKEDLGLSIARNAVHASHNEAKAKLQNVDYGRESLADELAIEVGRGLLPLVDPREGQPLTKRVSSLRQSLAQELGFVVPGVRFRDNLSMQPNSFRILVRDEECFTGEVYLGRWIAIAPEHIVSKIRGIHTKDPVYNMPAVWILEEDRKHCEEAGCVLFTAESVVGMALTNTARAHAGKLFSYGYFRDTLLQRLKKDEPSLAAVFEESHKLSRVAKSVCSRLLEEGVSIKDKVTILETLMETEGQDLSVETLTELIRKKISNTVCSPHLQNNRTLVAFFLSEELEALFLECLDQDKKVLAPDIHQKRKLRQSMKFALEDVRERGACEVLITIPELRRPIWEFFHSTIPTLVVLSEDEIPNRVEVNGLGEAVSRYTRPAADKQRRRPYPHNRCHRVRPRKFRRR